MVGPNYNNHVLLGGPPQQMLQNDYQQSAVNYRNAGPANYHTANPTT